ncbi:MAG TPA: hemerythrin domain-containing protein [Desulfopila sp.]|nr:hemerythrin domain-containing protein [Desulfopila sp.]
MSEHEFLKHLRQDHEEQKALGKKLISATNAAEREELRTKFHASLYPHMVGEEASMFQFLSQAQDEEARDDGLEALQEHHVAKIVLRELMALDLDSEVFKAKATVLDELNRHHIEEEEEDVFSHLQKLCDEQKLGELFQAYEEAEEQAK